MQRGPSVERPLAIICVRISLLHLKSCSGQSQYRASPSRRPGTEGEARRRGEATERSLKRNKAGTLPIAAKCQLEHLASGGSILGLKPHSARVVIFYARSFLAAGLDQSVRIL